MESPVRKLQKRNDYNRHKLLRKIKRRRKAAAEQQAHAAEKALKKKLRITPPKFEGGKNSKDIDITYVDNPTYNEELGLFKDDNGWAFYCFNEQKQFGTYDVYKEICGYNMKVVFKTLWSQLTPGQQDMMKSRFGEFDDKAEIQSEQSFIKFSQRAINYQQLLQELENDLKV